MTKEEKKEYMKVWNREYRIKNRDAEKARQKAYQDSLKDEHYTVYYLPEDNYVGVTNALVRRLKEHKKRFNRHTESYEVMFTSSDKKEAYAFERKLHGMGYGGLNTGEYRKT